ncbi:MAG: hypothetical protein R2774_15235 [Saprospiraceae bacterium]
MRKFFIFLIGMFFIYYQAKCNNLGLLVSDTLKRNITITYQPILNISPEELLLQYIAINVEVSKPRSNVSMDLHNIFTYLKSKVDEDTYRSIEHFSFLEMEFGTRFYLKSFSTKKKKLKDPYLNELENYSDLRPSGLYIKPALGVGLSYYIKDEIDISENIHRIRKKIQGIPTLGFYLGYKQTSNRSKLVIHPYIGIKAGADLENKVIYISPLISFGLGVYF